jgi:hypothetical protein
MQKTLKWTVFALVPACVSLVSSGAAGTAAAAVVATAARTGPSSVTTALIARGWGRALEVPGTRALNQGGNAEVSSLSCASAGNSSAGGFYTRRPGIPSGVRGERAQWPLAAGG